MKNLSNKVQLIGRLGADPKVKILNGKTKTARINLATSDYYYNKAGEKIAETQWHNLVFWGGLADVCEKYLTKGEEIAIEGRLGYRMYTDSENNNKYITEVTVTDLLMISKRKAG